MSEWGIALIAAGSAVAGSIVTGWFTRSTGLRQAEAARHAGDRQADALLHTVQATLDEQRRSRVDERRRQTYIDFLDAAEGIAWLSSNDAHELSPLLRAIASVSLEGPEPVEEAARALLPPIQEIRDARRRQNSQAEEEAGTAFRAARRNYLDAIKQALDGDAPSTGESGATS
ncbi:hypothetical protein ACQEV9_07510 [Streptomyces chartreusis]|uniref:hypothetical protein n=1 Tax=Streptomyces chartreusis TaxID=1969 RepID=UPI003D8EC788